MKIVSDRAMDMSPEQMAGPELQLAPLLLTLEGQTYRSGVDIQPDEFYERLAASANFPTTSQPSAGDFAAISIKGSRAFEMARYRSSTSSGKSARW